MSRPCVYTAYAEDGSVLYVGHTDDLSRRMHWHRSYSPWTLDCWTIETVEFPTVTEARAAELYVIAHFNPPWNWRSRTIPNPRRKPTLAENRAEVLRRRTAPDYEDSAEWRARCSALTDVLSAPTAVSA